MSDYQEPDVWARLAEPLDPEVIRSRDDRGTVIYYIDARTVIERLNSVVPGQWHFETELLHVPSGEKGDKWVFKGRLTVLGCVHEDVGMNENELYFDPAKAAVSDALKRCAVHFGIGIELYPGGGRGKPGKSTNVKPVKEPKPAQNAPPAAQDAPGQAQAAQVVQTDAGDLKFLNTPMGLLSGMDLRYIQEDGYKHCGMDNKFHFEARWKKRFPTARALKSIPLTAGEFFDMMADDYEGEEERSPQNTHTDQYPDEWADGKAEAK